MNIASIFMVIILIGICVVGCWYFLVPHKRRNISLPKVKNVVTKEETYDGDETSRVRTTPSYDPDETIIPGAVRVNNQKKSMPEVGYIVLELQSTGQKYEVPFYETPHMVGRNEISQDNKTISRNAFYICGTPDNGGPNSVRITVDSANNSFIRIRNNVRRTYSTNQEFDLTMRDVLDISGNGYEVDSVVYYDRKASRNKNMTQEAKRENPDGGTVVCHRNRNGR